jgi:hypothetical protein
MVRKLAEDLSELRHPHALTPIGIGDSPVLGETVACVEATYLAQGHITHKACAVRRALHGAVVDHDDVTIRSHVDVKLKTSGPTPGSQPEGF